jgi:uncharacterized membrane protein YfcA
MHTHHRSTVFVVLALAIIIVQTAQGKHSRHPANPPEPSPSTDDDIEWGLRMFSALLAAGVVSLITRQIFETALSKMITLITHLLFHFCPPKACALSMSAGIGGGGVLVPIFNIILGLTIKEATGLSQAVIAASGVGVAIFSLTNPHPLYHWKPLIDFNLVLVLTPALLLGISFGVLVNAIAPTWFVTTAIAIVLTYMAQRMLRLAINLRNKERECEALEALRWSAEDAENGSDCALDSGGAPLATAINNSRSWARPKLPWTQIIELIALWIIFAGLQLGKSRHGRCTLPYAGLYLTQVLVALTATVYFVKQAVKKEAIATGAFGEEEEEHEGGENNSNGVPLLSSNYAVAPSHEREERENSNNRENSSPSLSKGRLTSAAGIAVGAGALAGLIGMGGGFLLNPLLLEIGIQPQVAAATSALMVLFSSSSATVAFAFDGRLDITLAAIFGSVCFLFGFLGVTTLSKVVKKRGASAVVFLLAGVMILGLVATVGFGGRRVWHEISVAGELPGFQSFCKHRHHHDSISTTIMEILK